MSLLYLFLLSITLTIPQVHGLNCTRENVDWCTAEVQPYMASVVRGIVPTVHPEFLSSHCPLIEEAFRCLDDLLYKCHYDSQVELLSIRSAYDFICGTGRLGYQEHYACLQSEGVVSEALLCNTTFYERLGYAMTAPYYSVSPSTLICKYANDQMDCVQNSVQELCTEGAGLWLREFVTQLLQPAYQAQGCQFHEFRMAACGAPSAESTVKPASTAKPASATNIEEKNYNYNNSGAVALLTVFVILLIIALVVTCGVFYVMRRRLLKQIDRMSRTTVRYNGGVAAGGVAGGFVNPLSQGSAVAGNGYHQKLENAPSGSSAPPLPNTEHAA